jgi:hypothetical protein
MSFSLEKFSVLGKFIAVLFVLCFVTSCFRPNVTVPKSKYNSEDMSKQWRENVQQNAKPFTQPPSYRNYRQQPQQTQDYPDYPADNDADYVAPKYEYRLVPVEQKPAKFKPSQQSNSTDSSYPHDNDSDEMPAYPTYDPDADNSEYYYLNKDKKLPPPKKTNNSKNPELYDYPIYFD